MFKLEFRDAEYIVNEAKSAVTCILHCMPRFSFNGNYISWGTFDPFNVEDSDSHKPFKVIAVARVKGDDTFNVETGKKVAYAKAQIRAYKEMNRRARIIASKLNKYVQSTMDCIIKHNNYINDSIDDLKAENYNK